MTYEAKDFSFLFISILISVVLSVEIMVLTMSTIWFFSPSSTYSNKYKEKMQQKRSNKDKPALLWCDSCACSFSAAGEHWDQHGTSVQVSVINAQLYRWFESQTGKLRASWIDWQGNDHPNLLIIVSNRIVCSCSKAMFCYR